LASTVSESSNRYAIAAVRTGLLQSNTATAAEVVAIAKHMVEVELLGPA
jgi:hypothetical protein